MRNAVQIILLVPLWCLAAGFAVQKAATATLTLQNGTHISASSSLIEYEGAPEAQAQQDVAKYEQEKNVKKLIAVMQDEKTNVSVRQEAATALGRLRDARALNPLLSGLQDRNLRRNTSWALGNLGDKKAIEPLVLVLTDKSSLGREESAQALGKLGWEPANERERAYYLAAKREWDGCVGLGSLGIEPLVRILSDGPDNARIGAAEALGRLGWKASEDNREAYSAAKALKTEREAIVEQIVAKEMTLKREYEDNRQKLREDTKAGHLALSPEEIRSLEERFNQDIAREEDEIEAFRSGLSRTGFTVTRFGDQTFIGREPVVGEERGARGGIVVFQEKRSPVGKLVEGIWRSPWTEKVTKVLVWETGEFYRFTSDGAKYLYAKFNFGQVGWSSLLSIDILDPDGGIRERIWFNNPGWRPRQVVTRIGQDKWIEWPSDIKWASERLDLLEVISLGGSFR